MQEVLQRRYGKGEHSKPLPDLLIVDGGKGQLNIAVAVLRRLKLDNALDIIGIAKKDVHKGQSQDKIYKPGRANPVNFDREANLLLFLQKIRDEAHRFAITFQRRRRGVTSMRSALDSVPGVGKKRKEMLLRHFGGIKAIRAATIDELSTVPGINRKIAGIIKTRLSLSD